VKHNPYRRIGDQRALDLLLRLERVRTDMCRMSGESPSGRDMLVAFDETAIELQNHVRAAMVARKVRK
jgi:hypothetical protein